MTAISFTLDPACAGGNHYRATLTVGGRSVELPFSHRALLEPITSEEFQVYARVTAKLVAQNGDATGKDDVRSRLAALRLAI